MLRPWSVYILVAVSVSAAPTLGKAEVALGSGPFGFKIGDDIKYYSQCEAYKPYGVFFCKSAPNGISEALYYEVSYNYKTGICAVSAEVLLQRHALGRYGVDDKIRDYARQLDLKYGTHRGADRLFIFSWDSVSGMTPQNEINEVYITEPLEADIGYTARIQFNSDRFERCVKQNDLDFRERNLKSDMQKANKF